MLNDTVSVAPSRFFLQMVAGAVLVNLAMFFLVGLILYQSYDQYQHNAEKMTQSLAHILEESFAGMLARIDTSMLSTIDEVHRQYTSGKINPVELNVFLEKRRARLPEIDSLRIANAAGIVSYGTGVLPGSNVDINDRKHFIYFKSQNDGRLFISEPVFARINKKWVLPIARRLDHPDGTFAGIVYALVSLEKISTSFSHIEAGQHGIVNLRDSGMNIIVRYPEPALTQAIIGKNTMSPPLKALLDAGKTTGTYRVSGILDHVERTYSYRKVSQYPLYITVGFSSDDYLAQWRNSSLKLVGLSVAFLVISILLLGMLYRGEHRRREAVDALQVLNRDFMTLLEGTTDFIYFKDRDSRIRFCSQTLARITGHKSWREMIGKHDREIFPEDVARIYSEEELPLFNSGTPIFNRIDPYYDSEGQQGWVSTNKWPVFADDGKTVTGIFGISRDISDFKRAEISLSLSEARYRATFDHAAVGMHRYLRTVYLFKLTVYFAIFSAIRKLKCYRSVFPSGRLPIRKIWPRIWRRCSVCSAEWTITTKWKNATFAKTGGLSGSIFRLRCCVMRKVLRCISSVQWSILRNASRRKTGCWRVKRICAPSLIMNPNALRSSMNRVC